jgi:hypothetical protein
LTIIHSDFTSSSSSSATLRFLSTADWVAAFLNGGWILFFFGTDFQCSHLKMPKDGSSGSSRMSQLSQFSPVLAASPSARAAACNSAAARLRVLSPHTTNYIEATSCLIRKLHPP